MIRLFVFLCVMFASATVFAAERRQAGNVVFTPPKDWRVGPIHKNGWVTIFNKRKDERCRFCFIRIHIGAPAKGSFNAWVRKRMKLALDDGKVKKNFDTKIVQDETLGRVHIFARTIKARGDETQMFIAFRMDDRWEMIHFEGEARTADDMKDSQAAMREEFLPILKTIGFVSEGAKPVLGEPTPGKLDGTWFGSKLRYGVSQYEIDDVIYTFWSNGRFFEGVPLSGISKFDAQEAIMTKTSKVGNYYLEGERVMLEYADGDEDSLKFDDDAISDGTAYLSKVRLPEDGFRFKGTLSNFRYSSFSGGVNGGVASSSSWKFFEDGSFESDSFVGTSGSFDGGGGFAISNDTDLKRGRYQVADGLIHLDLPKGKEIVWPFFLDSIKGEERIVIRGEFLE